MTRDEHNTLLYCAGVAATMMSGATARAQICGAWTRVADSPTQMLLHAATYDAIREHVVIYDAIVSCAVNQTWAWDGAGWKYLADTEWGCRTAYAAAYDNDRAVVVLYGGQGAGFHYDDTLEWDGMVWKWRDQSIPPARDYHAMAYDLGRNRMVMYGGSDEDVLGFDETWEWDGIGVWKMASPAATPGGLASHAMAYDDIVGECVVFGGQKPSASKSSETWTYDGVTWTLRSETGPEARSRHAMAYDSWRGLVMMFGGSNETQDKQNDLWEWDGQAWNEVAIPPMERPPARREFAMAFDSKRGVLVVNGGEDEDGDLLSDTWEYRPCIPDCERDCDLDIFDYLCFQDRYVNQSPYADFERDGDLDIFDFLEFQNQYVQGCQ